jgi:hypothetical protein
MRVADIHAGRARDRARRAGAVRAGSGVRRGSLAILADLGGAGIVVQQWPMP